MKRLPSIWLILMSAIWMINVYVEGAAARTRGLSNAMELEVELYHWADTNAPKEAVREIFNEDRRLLLGGEHPTWTFREMIEHIATDAVPPLWPALIGFSLGGIGLILGGSKSKTKNAEQSGYGDAEEVT